MNNISKMLDFGPNNQWKNLDLIMHMLQVLLLVIILNGEDSINQWDKKTNGYTNTGNHLLKV